MEEKRKKKLIWDKIAFRNSQYTKRHKRNWNLLDVCNSWLDDKDTWNNFPRISSFDAWRQRLASLNNSNSGNVNLRYIKKDSILYVSCNKWVKWSLYENDSKIEKKKENILKTVHKVEKKKIKCPECNWKGVIQKSFLLILRWNIICQKCYWTWEIECYS